MNRRPLQGADVPVIRPLRTWNRMADSTASTRSLKSTGTSAERVMAILSSKCSLSGPSSGLKVAISSGRHLQTADSLSKLP